MTTILTKKKDTTGAPAPGDLTNAAGGAELAVNTYDKRLYTKDSGGNVVEIGTNPTILNIDNIEINGNTISSTNSNGNIILAPNGTGQIVVNSGSASAPIITPTGDVNTGLFFPAADTVAIAGGGTERMRIADNVGIGVTPSAWGSGATSMIEQPNGTALGNFGNLSQTILTANCFYNSSGQWIYKNTAGASYYNQNGGGHSWYVAGSGTAGTSISGFADAKMVFTSSGYLGIGTVTPGVPLDVVSNSGAEVLRLRGRSADNIGTVRFTSNDGATQYSAIQSRSTYIEIATNTSIPMIFGTATAAGGAERMRITEDGKVGVRTTTPSTFLDVFNTSGSTTPALRVSAQDGAGDDNICIGFYETTRAIDMGRVGARYVSNSGGGYGNLDLYSTQNGTCTARATVDSYGNFCVGYIYPDAYVGTTANSSQLVTLNSVPGLGDMWLIKTNSGTLNQRSHIIRFNNYSTAGFARNDDTILGGMYFQASQPTSGALQDAGAIYCTSESQSGNSTSSGLSFYTNSGSAGNVLAMYINSGRYVGFGTRAPSYRITTDSTATNDADILLRKSNSGTANQNGQALRFWNLHPANTGRNAGVICGELYFGFSQPTSGNTQDAAQIIVASDISQAGTGTPSKMMFYTCPNGSSNSFAGYFNYLQCLGVGSQQTTGRVTSYQYDKNSYTCVTSDGANSGDYGINWKIDTNGHVFARIKGSYTSSAASGYGYITLQTSAGAGIRDVLTAGDNGTITFNLYGAGTLSTNSSGNISASDGRYKTKTRELTDARSKIKQLAELATYYRWNPDSPWGKDSQEEEIGWVAQDVGGVIPEASPEPKNPEQFRNYHDRAILAYLTKALADLTEEFEQYKATHP